MADHPIDERARSFNGPPRTCSYYMGSRRRVLFICRFPAVMVELFGQLSPQGYELFATPDMRGAARQAYELRPDAVLLFIDDPQADDWAPPLQTLRSLSPVPIIALANSAQEADRQRVMDRGVDACYLAPFDGDAVVAQLDVLTWPGYQPQRPSMRADRWV